MNRRPSPIAAAIMGSVGLDVQNPMRYQFLDNEKHEGFVIVYDLVKNQAVMELWKDHAQMIYLMYSRQHQKQPQMADEFMYGHIMGHTMTMTYGAYYPKIEIIRGENGVIIVKQTEIDGTVSENTRNDEQFELDLKGRIEGE